MFRTNVGLEKPIGFLRRKIEDALGLSRKSTSPDVGIRS